MFCTHEQHLQSFCSTLGYRIDAVVNVPAITRVFVCDYQRNKVTFKTMNANNQLRWSAEKVYAHIHWDYESLVRANDVVRVARSIAYHDSSLDTMIETPPCGGRLVAHVREYIDGDELSDWLDASQYDMLKETVAQLHDKGIARLDLGPNNIIVDEDKRPFLIDLGGVFSEHEPNRFNEYKKWDYELLEQLRRK